jgi:hypothetical protein
MRRGRVAVLLVAAAVALAVAVAAASAPQVERPVISEVRGCKTRGDGSRPSKPPAAPPGVQIGPITIWPTVHRSFPGGGATAAEWPWVTKAPIIVAARARVVLAIAPEAASIAGLAARHGYVSAVRFEACREREPAFGYRGTVGKFTGFPFAFALKQPSACVPIELWVDGQDAPIGAVVAVGRTDC